jgi:hypothetical protein
VTTVVSGVLLGSAQRLSDEVGHMLEVLFRHLCEEWRK